MDYYDYRYTTSILPKLPSDTLFAVPMPSHWVLIDLSNSTYCDCAHPNEEEILFNRPFSDVFTWNVWPDEPWPDIIHPSPTIDDFNKFATQWNALMEELYGEV